MARGGQHPTVEPAFRTPQEKPPALLDLNPSITRFLYLREVEGLLGQHVDRDEEALAVEQAALMPSQEATTSRHVRKKRSPATQAFKT